MQVNAQTEFIQLRVDTVDNIITKLDKKKKLKYKRYSGQIDSVRHTEGLSQRSIWGIFKKDKLIKIRYNFVPYEGEIGNWEIIYYINNGALICIEEKFFPLIRAGGPNWYELRYHGKFYVKDNQLLYRKIESTDQYLSIGSRSIVDLIKDFYIFKELVQKIR